MSFPGREGQDFSFPGTLLSAGPTIHKTTPRIHHHGSPRQSHSATGGPHDVRQGKAPRAGRSGGSGDLSPGSHGMFFIGVSSVSSLNQVSEYQKSWMGRLNFRFGPGGKSPVSATLW